MEQNSLPDELIPRFQQIPIDAATVDAVRENLGKALRGETLLGETQQIEKDELPPRE